MKIKTIKTIQESQELAQVWLSLNGNQQFGTLTPEVLTQKSTNCRQLLDTFTALSSQIQDVRVRLVQEVGDLSKDESRVHQGIRASYGVKSPEYVRAQKTRSKSNSRRSNTSSTPPDPPQA